MRGWCRGVARRPHRAHPGRGPGDPGGVRARLLRHRPGGAPPGRPRAGDDLGGRPLAPGGARRRQRAQRRAPARAPAARAGANERAAGRPAPGALPGRAGARARASARLAHRGHRGRRRGRSGHGRARRDRRPDPPPAAQPRRPLRRAGRARSSSSSSPGARRRRSTAGCAPSSRGRSTRSRSAACPTPTCAPPGCRRPSWPRCATSRRRCSTAPSCSTGPLARRRGDRRPPGHGARHRPLDRRDVPHVRAAAARRLAGRRPRRAPGLRHRLGHRPAAGAKRLRPSATASAPTAASSRATAGRPWRSRARAPTPACADGPRAALGRSGAFGLTGEGVRGGLRGDRPGGRCAGARRGGGRPDAGGGPRVRPPGARAALRPGRERLGVARSSLSETIRRLEAKLGTVLFERTSRRVDADPRGARLLPGRGGW